MADAPYPGLLAGPLSNEWTTRRYDSGLRFRGSFLQDLKPPDFRQRINIAGRETAARLMARARHGEFLSILLKLCLYGPFDRDAFSKVDKRCSGHRAIADRPLLTIMATDNPTRKARMAFFPHRFMWLCPLTGAKCADHRRRNSGYLHPGSRFHFAVGGRDHLDRPPFQCLVRHHTPSTDGEEAGEPILTNLTWNPATERFEYLLENFRKKCALCGNLSSRRCGRNRLSAPMQTAWPAWIDTSRTTTDAASDFPVGNSQTAIFIQVTMRTGLRSSPRGLGFSSIGAEQLGSNIDLRLDIYYEHHERRTGALGRPRYRRHARSFGKGVGLQESSALLTFRRIQTLQPAYTM
jgi:hypothetical protein